jgi:hypothetical protein
VIDEDGNGTARDCDGGIGRAFSFSWISADEWNCGAEFVTKSFGLVAGWSGCAEAARAEAVNRTTTVHPQSKLPQGGQDMGSPVMFHALVVLSPQRVAAVVATVLDIPMSSHQAPKALGTSLRQTQTADPLARLRLAPFFIERLGARADDALGKGKAA